MAVQVVYVPMPGGTELLHSSVCPVTWKAALMTSAADCNAVRPYTRTTGSYHIRAMTGFKARLEGGDHRSRTLYRAGTQTRSCQCCVEQDA